MKMTTNYGAADEPVPTGGGGGGGWVGAALNAGATYYAGRVARKNTDKTIAANKNLAEYAYAQDLEMWNRMNQYNSPEEQMKRLKEAGLNPHLVYGTGAPGNTTGQLPQYNAPDVEYKYEPYAAAQPIQEGILAFQDMELKKAQVDNVKANTDKVAAETANEIIRKSHNITEDSKRKLDLSIMDRLQEYTVDKGKYQASEAKHANQLRHRQAIAQGIKNELLTMEKEWMKSGITPRDKLYLRMAAQLLQKFGVDDAWLTSMIKKWGTP